MSYEEAVEAAAKAIVTQALQTGEDGKRWEDMDRIERWNIKAIVLPMVSAAAPILQTEAWEEGRAYVEMYRGDLDHDPTNPYRGNP